MSLSSVAQATISISVAATAISSIAPVLADYTSDTFVNIGNLYDIGDFGDSVTEIKVELIDNARVQKLNGTRDGGDMSLIVARNASDAGQLACIAASQANFNHAFKVVMNDPLTPTGTGSTFSFLGLVQSAAKKLGTANNTVMITFKIAINSPVVYVAPTVGA